MVVESVLQIDDGGYAEERERNRDGGDEREKRRSWWLLVVVGGCWEVVLTIVGGWYGVKWFFKEISKRVNGVGGVSD